MIEMIKIYVVYSRELLLGRIIGIIYLVKIIVLIRFLVRN